MVREAEDRLESTVRSCQLGHLGFSTGQLEAMDRQLGPALAAAGGIERGRWSYAGGLCVPRFRERARATHEALKERLELQRTLQAVEQALGRRDLVDAAARLDRLEAEHDDEPWVHLLRARAAWFAGRRPEAEAALSRARTLGADSPFFQRARL